MRLIDADALENQFGISDADLLALDEIRHAPAVDAEVVVRCKDCVDGMMSDNNEYAICCRLGVGMKFEDFCSYGERKNG